MKYGYEEYHGRKEKYNGITFKEISKKTEKTYC